MPVRQQSVKKLYFSCIYQKKAVPLRRILVFAIRERRTIYQELLFLSGYEGARFSYTIKEIDVKRT